MSQQIPVATHRRRRWLVISAWVAWTVATLACAAYLALGHTLGDLNCEEPPGSSHYGHLVWHWAPTGYACQFEAAPLYPPYPPVIAHVDEPSGMFAPVALLVLVWPAARTVTRIRAVKFTGSANNSSS